LPRFHFANNASASYVPLLASLAFNWLSQGGCITEISMSPSAVISILNQSSLSSLSYRVSKLASLAQALIAFSSLAAQPTRMSNMSGCSNSTNVGCRLGKIDWRAKKVSKLKIYTGETLVPYSRDTQLTTKHPKLAYLSALGILSKTYQIITCFDYSLFS
jgi:hypothetical protein